MAELDPKETAALAQEATKKLQEMGVEASKIVPIIDAINKGHIKTQTALGYVITAETKRKKVAKEVTSEQQKINDEHDQTAKLQNAIAGALSNVQKYNKSILKDATKAIQAERAKVQVMYESGDMSAELLADKMAALDLIEKEAIAMDKVGTVASASYNAAADGIDSMVEGMNSFMSSVPGGSFLMDALGINDAASAIKDELAAEMSNYIKDVVAGETKLSGLQKVKIGLQKIFNVVTSMNPYVAIVAVVIGLLALLASVTKEAKEHAKATGLSVAKAKEQVEQARQLNSANMDSLASMKDILAVQTSMIEAYGRADYITGETAAKIADIGTTLGYGAETAAGVQQTLMTIGGASEEVAANMQIVAFEMAEAAGVAPGKVMKDMAKNGKLLAKSMAGNAKGMVKVAVYAAQMGSDIAGMVKMTDSLLDIETSLSAQMQYQAVSGNKIDLSKARHLKAIGKEEDAMKETMKVMEGMNVLDIESPIEREKAAAALGLGVDEMIKMATMQEKTKSMTDEQRNLVAKYGDQLGDITNMEADQMLAKSKQIQQSEKLMASFEKIKNLIISALGPAIAAIGDALDAAMPILETFYSITGLVWKVVGYILGLVGKLVKVIFQIGQFIGNLILVPFKAVWEVIKLIYENGIKPIGAVLGSIFSSIVKPFKDVWDQIKSIFTDIFGKSEETGESMGVMQTITSAVGTAFGYIGDAIGVVADIIGTMLKVAFWPLQKVAEFIAFIIGTWVKVFKFVGKIIWSALMVPFNAVKSVIEWIWDGIVKMGEVFSNIFTGIIDIIKSPFNMLIAGANAVISGLNSISVTVPKWVPFIGGKTLGFSIPEIPSFDTGGTVAETGMAVVHKGEQITPASKVPGSEPTGGGEGGGGILSKLFAKAKESIPSPMGMMGNAIGGLFGGGKEDPQITLLKEINANLLKYLANPVPAVVDANQAAAAVNTANTYNS